MIQWVHLRGKEWGRWFAREDTGWPKASLMARIREEGSVGAAIKQQLARVPVKLMPRAIAAFHRAFLSLPEQHRNVVAVMYRSSLPYEAKANALGVTKSTLYRLIDQSHGYLAARIDDGDNSQSSQSSQSGYEDFARVD